MQPMNLYQREGSKTVVFGGSQRADSYIPDPSGEGGVCGWGVFIPVFRIRIGSGFNQVLGAGSGFRIRIRIQGQESEEDTQLRVMILRKLTTEFMKNTVPGSKIPPALHQESR